MQRRSHARPTHDFSPGRWLGATARIVCAVACVLVCFVACSCGGGGSGGAAGAQQPPAPVPPATPPTTQPGPTGGGLCGAVQTIEDGRQPLAQVHVATSGDDQTGDGSDDAPYATVGRALDDVAPGTAIRIHPGEYAGTVWVTKVAGTAAAPIWIGGVPGEARPRIVGGGEAMHLSSVRYLVLHDLEITGAVDNGINCDDGGQVSDPDATRHLLIRDIWIHDVGGGGNNDGLKLSGLDDYVVRNCVFERIDAGSGIDHVGCHQGQIVQCRFDEMGSNAIQIKGGCVDIEVTRCQFDNAGHRAINIGGSTGFQFFRPPLSTATPNAEARDIRVIANLFGSATTPFAFVGAVDCLVANNTIHGGTHNWLFRILQETTSANGFTFLETQHCRIANNLFHFDRSALSTFVNVGANTLPATYTIEHNLWYAHDDPTQSTPNLPVVETNGIYGADPFAGAAGGAPRIPAGSAADGAGVATPDVTGDSDGACYKTPPSIGAYEAP